MESDNERIETARKNAEARTRSEEIERQHDAGTLAERATSRAELSRMIEAERASRNA